LVFYKNGVLVSVVNPLSVKRFIQIKLAKVKTDKSDAKMIRAYALINEVLLYTALINVQRECLQLFRELDNFIKHRTATKNKMHVSGSLHCTIIPSSLQCAIRMCQISTFLTLRVR
jgi:transposase